MTNKVAPDIWKGGFDEAHEAKADVSPPPRRACDVRPALDALAKTADASVRHVAEVGELAQEITRRINELDLERARILGRPLSREDFARKVRESFAKHRVALVEKAGWRMRESIARETVESALSDRPVNSNGYMSVPFGNPAGGNATAPVFMGDIWGLLAPLFGDIAEEAVMAAEWPHADTVPLAESCARLAEIDAELSELRAAMTDINRQATAVREALSRAG